MRKLSEAQYNVLRLCSAVGGFFAGDMSGAEKRTAQQLATKGYLRLTGGKSGHISPSGFSRMREHEAAVDAALLASASAWYSDAQLEEIVKASSVHPDSVPADARERSDTGHIRSSKGGPQFLSKRGDT